MKRKFNFLDTQGYITKRLCFTLEGDLAKPFVSGTGALCLARDGCAAGGRRWARGESEGCMKTASISGAILC